jgi:hypothetical protein
VPTALVNVLGDLRIEPSEGQHRHTAGGFLAIPHEVLSIPRAKEQSTGMNLSAAAATALS